MINNVKRILLLLLLGLFFVKVQAQLVTIETKLDTNSIELGRRAILSFIITKNQEDKIISPAFTDTISDGIEVLEPPVFDSVILDNGKNQINQQLTITSFEEGMRYIEAQPFVLVSSIGVDTIYSKDSYLKVLGVELDTTGVIRDIADVEHVKRTFRDILPILIIVFVLGLVAVIIFVIIPKYRKKSIEEEEEVQREPAHVIALRELDKLKAQKLWQQEKIKEYYSRLTGIVRKYLENQFSVQAMEETTNEILRDVRLRGLDTKLNMNDLEGLLNLADLIKFAKGKADPEDNIQHLDNAYKLVKGTQEIVQRVHTSIKVNEDDEFLKFVFSGIDKSVENSKKTNTLITPFIMIRKGEEQKIQRFESDDYQEAVSMADDYLKRLQPKPDFALLAYDGFIAIEGRKSEALYVKGFDKSENKGLVFAQRYQPKTDEMDFQLIGNPALVGKEDNVLRQIVSK